MKKQPEAQLSLLDKLGIFLSALCAVHCLLAPLVVFTFPYLILSIHNQWFHILVALCIVPIGVVAFHRGYLRHHDKRVYGLGIIGLLIILGASLVPHWWLHVLGHTAIMVTGSTCLIIAHAINYKVCKGCAGHLTNSHPSRLKTFDLSGDDLRRIEHSSSDVV